MGFSCAILKKLLSQKLFREQRTWGLTAIACRTAVILEKCSSFARLDTIFSQRKNVRDNRLDWDHVDVDEEPASPPPTPERAPSKRKSLRPRRTVKRSTTTSEPMQDISEERSFFMEETELPSPSVQEEDEAEFREQLNKIYSDISNLGQMWEKLQKKRSVASASRSKLSTVSTDHRVDLLHLLTSTLLSQKGDCEVTGNGLPEEYLDPQAMEPVPVFIPALPETPAFRPPLDLPPMEDLSAKKHPGKLPIPRLRAQAPPTTSQPPLMTFPQGFAGQTLLLNNLGFTYPQQPFTFILAPSTNSSSGPSSA